MSQQKEIGTLIVVVLKAQHLHQPSFYKQDPYAQVSLSGLKKQTKVDPKGGQHPVWDDELRFPVLADAGKDKVNRIVEISCYKDEQRGDDILLGKGMVDIEETLKTGEFDDWVPLVTSAGARGEVYLEMTFYANSPPPLTRRPSKLSPSDRLARPAAYFKQGRQLAPTSIPPSTQSGRSPVLGGERSNQSPSIGASQIPLSLIPAHGLQTQTSKQAPSSQGNTSTITTKQKDTLPPLPTNDPINVDSGNKLGVPATLYPGGRSGPRPMPPQGRNRVASVGRPSPETLPQEFHRRAVSDTPSLAPSFSRLQAPAQAYSLDTTSITGSRIGSTPSIVVGQHEDQPSLVLSTPLVTSPGATQGHEPRGVYATGDYDSFTHGPPEQVYLQPNSQGYTSCPTQGYPRTFSPSPHPVPVQSPWTPLGQPYDASPAMTSPPSLYQQYTPIPSGPPTPQPLPPPQMYSQLHSSQPHHVPHPPQPQQNPPFSQQPYIPPPQHQYHPQHLPYSQTPHPPNVSQSYRQPNHPGLPASSQPSAAAPTQQPPYSQTPQQMYLTVPPPPPVQPQTPEPYVPQLSHRQPQSYIPPPPPPPPPSLRSQGGITTPNPVSVTQPSQTPVPLAAPSHSPNPPPVSLPPSVAPVTPPLQPSTTTLPLEAVANAVPNSETEEVVVRKQVEEGENMIKPPAVAEAGTMLGEGAGGTSEDVVINQENEEQGSKIVEGELGQPLREQGTREAREHGQRVEEEDQQHEEKVRRQEELRRQEEDQNRQEAERRRREEEEQRKREEEERQRMEEEERRKQEQEGFRKREEERRKEEEYLKREKEEQERQEEEERRKKEEEERREREEEDRGKKEEEERRRREDEQKRQEEEEQRRREEERHRKKEEERRRQEEERIQREREEAARRRIAAEEEARQRRAEEAEAERRWQAELARIRARAEQETADAAFARAQMEAEEAERRRQEEADLALVRQVQEEAEREERLAQERRRQEEADREVARREQAHEEELERKREEETRRRMEEADRELARRLDMELNLGVEYGGDRPESRQRRTTRNGQH